MNEIFIKRLQISMEQSEINQSELAELSGISKQRISGYLKGEYEPKSKPIYALAKALGVSASWLMGLNDDAPAPPVEEASETKPRGKEDFLLSKFQLLNDAGQDKLLDYANDLVDNGRYLKIPRKPPISLEDKYSDDRVQIVGFGTFETRQKNNKNKPSEAVKRKIKELSQRSDTEEIDKKFGFGIPHDDVRTINEEIEKNINEIKAGKK